MSDEKQPFFVLAISGGGSRGLMALGIIMRIEKYLKIRFHEVFHLCAGTSAGALICAPICFHHKTASEIAEYLPFQRIMQKSIWDRIFGVFQTQPKYTGVGKTEVLRKLYGSDDRWTPTSPICLVTMYNLDKGCSEVWETTPEGARPNSRLSDVLDATSAAPLYFPARPVSPSPDMYIDGGVFANDPSICAYASALKYLKKRGTPNRPIHLMYIGTGEMNHAKEGKKLSKSGLVQWLPNGIHEILLNETIIPWQLERLTRPQDHILRINRTLGGVAKGLDNYSDNNLKQMDIWSQITFLKFLTKIEMFFKCVSSGETMYKIGPSKFPA